MWVVIFASFLIVLTMSWLQFLRFSDRRDEQEVWRFLEQTAASEFELFDAGSVADLPDPARRYFLWAIAPGARLTRAAEITMTGEIGLGTRRSPNFLPMRARQILVGPYGFIWRLRAGSGLVRISGSDGYAGGRGWTRFWLWNLFPVARLSSEADHARSAAGRAVAEWAFWIPAALLPRPDVVWEPVDEHTARARVTLDGNTHVVDVTVAADGQLCSVLLQRWSRENAEREWRLQPFGGTVEQILEVDGYRLAARVIGGNWFGTEDYFPFYHAEVSVLRFLRAVP